MNILGQTKYKVLIASDVSTRDGIGLEIYEYDDLILDIFRDDTDKTKQLTVFKNPVSVELMKEALQVFEKEIPEDFQD
jgi:hypothetical protein